MEQTKIEWCDSTFNPWEGCTKVGPGCDHCYAEARNNRFKGGNWGPGAPRRRTSEANWRKPLKWNAEPFWQCPECGWRGIEKDSGMWTSDDGIFPTCPDCEADIITLKPARRRVFCASLSDWLDNEAPTEWLLDLLDLIRKTPNLDWLLLTKRIGIWRSRLELATFEMRQDFARSDKWHATLKWLDDWLHGNPPDNVWLGATVVNQEEANRDIPKLLQVPARIRFLSVEPMLGPIDFDKCVDRYDGVSVDLFGHFLVGPFGSSQWDLPKINWTICGGESGPHARPMHPDWVRSLRDQCQAAGVPFLFKQWGEWIPGKDAHDNGIIPIEQHHPWGLCQPAMARVGKNLAGNLLEGRQHLEWPA